MSRRFHRISRTQEEVRAGEELLRTLKTQTDAERADLELIKVHVCVYIGARAALELACRDVLFRGTGSDGVSRGASLDCPPHALSPAVSWR